MKLNKKPRNRTLEIENNDIEKYLPKLLNSGKFTIENIGGRIIHGDMLKVLSALPSSFVNLLFIDPPYNLTKDFGGNIYRKSSDSDYEKWLDSWLKETVRLLKPDASIYICADWASSNSVYKIAGRYFNIVNRITWQREKGRGSAKNWKNVAEDIWFCSLSKNYKFYPDRVKLKKKVIAPYRDEAGNPKDWQDGEEKYRLTAPSNIWTDISIPFWSMPENTPHPTQKPEKLLAKIILASSDPGDFVFDPFLGSGTTAVVAKKLGRKFSGIEQDLNYCCLGQKRLEMADKDKAIQGYRDGIFLERNAKQ